MRGTQCAESAGGFPRGIIPADAGNTPAGIPPASGSWDHPRGCGEHVQLVVDERK